ncbi:hypothetical protein [Capnocytophaga gingivalis]|uniref:hypothetical protein n=1 Tax=Capnocytophaga gingivalis TaxID=1017 RepID=UPI0028ECC9A2|nr:hypothetical protein [Capnocytophaga gingivalis]
MIFLISRFQLELSNNNKEIFKLISDVSQTLGDHNWQNSISKYFINDIDADKNVYKPYIAIYFRFFYQENLALKTYAKFLKQKEELIIDPIIIIDDYINYDEDTMKKKMADEIFSIFERYLIKYQRYYNSFDAIRFLIFLKERMQLIKDSEISLNNE